MGGKDLVKLNEIIKICVGGQDFKTTRATLMSDQNSMLAKMLETESVVVDSCLWICVIFLIIIDCKVSLE